MDCTRLELAAVPLSLGCTTGTVTTVAGAAGVSGGRRESAAVGGGRPLLLALAVIRSRHEALAMTAPTLMLGNLCHEALGAPTARWPHEAGEAARRQIADAKKNNKMGVYLARVERSSALYSRQINFQG